MPSPENNIFSSLIYKYLPYWPLFALLLTVSSSGTWGYLEYFAIPSYQTSASLIIKDENKGVNDAKITESIDAFTSNKIVENEIKVLYSHTLLKEVVNKLNLYAPVFEEEKFRTTSAYVTSPVHIEVKHPEDIEETAKVYFKLDKDKKHIIIQNKKYVLEKWVQTPYGELRFTRNVKEAGTAKNPLYFSLIKPEKVIESIHNDLKIEAENKLSTVVNLRFYDQVPARGEDILNSLILTYNSIALNERNMLAANTLKFVEDRIRLVEEELKSLENKVVNYKSSEGVINLSEQGRLFLESIESTDQKISNIDLQLAVLDKVESYIISKDKTKGIVPSTLGLNDPVLSQLLQKLYNTEIEYQKLRNTTAENNPMLLILADEIQNIRPSILENLKNQRIALQASRSKLASTNRQYQSALKFIPKQEKELMEISRQQAIKNNAYSFLLQKREETVLSYAPSAGESRIVDMARTSTMPVKPRPLHLYLVAVIIAFTSSIGIITSKEVLSNKLLFRAEIEEATTIPIVAELSMMKLQKGGNTFREPTEPAIVEQFRKLRITMGLYGQSDKRKIMVTSSIPGEGKSFVSSNLAYSLATSNKKVVLLDFDLRNPNTSVLFDAYEQEGIIEFLSGDANHDKIIKNTNFFNLKIIPAGLAIGDHTNLILEGRFKGLLNYLETKFDYIIVDTPPVDLVSDAYVLSEHCDVTLLVLRHAYTPKNLVHDLPYNTLGSLSNVAIIFNGVKPRGFAKKLYGYGYGYGRAHIYEDKTYNTRKIKTRA